MNRLVIIDGNAVMHRAYHAIPPLTAPDGSVVNAVYGFANMLLRLHHDLAPSHLAVVFDRPAPTFRKTLYPGYQNKRPKMEDSLSSQFPKVHALVEAFGVPIFEQDGFEADDVIGTLCGLVKSPKSKVQSQIDQVIVVTGDRDILQLVDGERVMVYMPVKGLSEGKIYREQDVMDRLGVLPIHITVFMGLAGDSSDNYPGVGGIGPKTAIDLINRFGSVEGVYEYLESKVPSASLRADESQKSKVIHESVKSGGGEKELSQGVIAKLLKGRQMAFLSKDLATIRCNVEFEGEIIPIPTLDTPKAREAIGAFHFHSLLKRMNSGALNSESRIMNNEGNMKQETRDMGQESINNKQNTKIVLGKQQELF